jgi:hypothetical protein
MAVHKVAGQVDTHPNNGHGAQLPFTPVKPPSDQYEYQGDSLIYRMVVVVLGLVMLAGIGGTFALTLYEKQIPEIFLALSSGAVGALAGLLAPSPAKRP